MPPIWSASKFATRHHGQVEIILFSLTGRGCLPERQDSRKSLGGPENRLFIEGLLWISREKKGPIAVEKSLSRRSIAVHPQGSENHFGSWHHGVATPRLCPSIQHS